ncbi:MAG TPA: hypothetical protein PLQ34_09480 [Ferrovaceae bacterium]|nr:hypothetical protein [Ferrovaceae bacterium]
MSTRFASARHAISQCDVCGQRYKLLDLKPVVIKTKVTNILACPECWDPDHPQLMIGMYPINDPIAVRNPRPDISLSYGDTPVTSLAVQWSWNPVGLAGDMFGYVQNTLVGQGTVNSVTISN